MSSKPKVLFVLTSQRTVGDTDRPTGWFLSEFAHPYHELAPHVQVSVASPAGGEAPLAPDSIKPFEGDKTAVDFLNTKEALWKDTEKLSAFVGRAHEFAAIFYVGGHGPMFDLATDATSHQLIREFFEADKVVAAVCHGPAALVNAKLSDGTFVIAASPVTGFSNVEEDQAGMTPLMPFLLETELAKNSGGKYEKAAEPWAEKVVVARAGRLITGQNPASATGVGKAIKAALKI
ncbi:MAG: hypothetical protein M1832_005439 [Thelocarpon impressellum]|nr:MAG: hypothetical protein M1832_005439 [Thelocarpon impressellum]